jgi:hypothetical protein
LCMLSRCSILWRRHPYGWIFNKLTYKYIWTNHLFINDKRFGLVRIKTSNINNNKSNNAIITITLNVCISCLYVCVVLRSSVCHGRGHNYPKFMHKFKYI